ncbi:MAG: hypothetical protein JWQ38_504 [Flavipsychrobacter sp.]|nr:hypothetical protein [Flavipsychrobacter sp.]
MKKIIRISAIAMSFAITTIGHAQIISTVAGTGIAGYSGDGSAATAAKLNQPGGIYIDGSGTIYLADRGNNCIRKISGGIITTIAGTTINGYSGDGGPATAAKFNHPIQLAMDGAGNLIIADVDNNVIRKINSAGIITTIAGTGVAGYNGDGIAASTAQLNGPLGLAIDASNNIIIGEVLGHRVRKINPAGIISTIAGNGTAGFSGDGFAATSAKLHNPNYLTADGSGNIFFSDNGNHRIRKITVSTGVISTIAGDGGMGYTGDGVAATSTSLLYPANQRVDAAGNVYIADSGNDRIRKVDIAGVITTIVGIGVRGFAGDGSPATAAEINGVTDICFDNSGALYIADFGNNRLRIVGPGNKTPVFTGGHNQSLSVCFNTNTSVDTLLKIMDADSGQPETWNLFSTPAHGTATVTYSATSTGTAIIPTGLQYTPAMGYTGTDVFKVIISDGIASDTTTINVTVDPLPSAGVISGIDNVCPGNTVALAETVSGGIWSSSDAYMTLASHTGNVKGVIPGKDTIIYTVINSCGIVSAIFPFTVKSYIECHTGMTSESTMDEGINIYPNPNSGNFTVEIRTANEEQTRITIVNILGQHIKEITISSNKPTDIILDIPSGVYILNATTSGQQWSKKIMINTGR